jgi:digeranylgeranylglycerophospholipid reductase
MCVYIYLHIKIAGRLKLIFYEVFKKMEWDVLVVGGGPAGCFAAEHIAKHGFKVLVLEENSVIGEPVQCAGLVSHRTIELTGCQKLILNSLKGANVYSPNGKSMKLAGSRSYAFAIDRALLDQELALRAQKSGVEVLLSARVTNLKRHGKGIVVEFRRGGSTLTAATKLLIGADGANSLVARWASLYQPREKIKMFAAEVKLQNPFPEMVDIFLGSHIAPGWFGWIIPIDKKRARIGTGSSFINISGRKSVKKFLNVYSKRFYGMEIIRETGGLVPIGTIQNHASNVMLVGDAACQTKPISGGGLYPGLMGAIICSQVAVKALMAENFSREFLSGYQLQWNQKMHSELEKALNYREMFVNLSDFQLSLLIKILNTNYWRSLISEYMDIGYPSIVAEKLFEKYSFLFFSSKKVKKLETKG